MKRFGLVVALLAAAGALAVVAAGCGGGGKKSGKGGKLTALPTSACAKPVGPSDAKYIVASDLPLQGAGRAQTEEMVKAIEFVLKQRNYTAGKYKVQFPSQAEMTICST